jgi:hypothetical protein
VQEREGKKRRFGELLEKRRGTKTRLCNEHDFGLADWPPTPCRTRRAVRGGHEAPKRHAANTNAIGLMLAFHMSK